MYQIFLLLLKQNKKKQPGARLGKRHFLCRAWLTGGRFAFILVFGRVFEWGRRGFIEFVVPSPYITHSASIFWHINNNNNNKKETFFFFRTVILCQRSTTAPPFVDCFAYSLCSLRLFLLLVSQSFVVCWRDLALFGWFCFCTNSNV